MIVNSNFQDQIKCCLDISATAPRSLKNTTNLITEINTFNFHKLRLAIKSQEMTSIRSTIFFSTIHTNRNGNINRSYSTIAIATAAHRTRSIYDSNTIKCRTIDIISKVFPILINHQSINSIDSRSFITIPTIYTSHCFTSSFYTFIRIKSLSIYLSSSILGKIFISFCSSLCTFNIMSGKSILIKETGTRRNLIKFNFIPLARGHKTFKNINTFTQNRKSFTILLRSHTQITTSFRSKITRFLRTGVFRLQPLSQKRRSFTSKIQCKLFLHKLKCFILARSADKQIQIIPTSKFRNILQITLCCINILSSQPLHADAEKSTFTLAATYITQIEKALQCIRFILFKSLLKKENTIIITSGAITTTKSKHIIECSKSRTIRGCTIFSSNSIFHCIDTIHKFIHN